MRKLVFLILCILLSVISCVEDKRTTSKKNADLNASAADQKTANIDRFMREGPAFPIGSGLDEIMKNLGEPLKRTVTERQNVHNKTLVDEVYRLYYEGLYLEIYHVTEMKKDILLLLEVTGDKYPLAFGLRVGNAKQKVRDVLGRPNEERAGLWRYHASDFVMGSFEFAFQGDTVVSVKWYYTID
jgi:hypothetical protein